MAKLPSHRPSLTLSGVSGLLAQFRGNLRQHALLPRDGRLVVAVSGGVDSVVLLHLLHALAAKPGLMLIVAHADHQLRGAASAGDAALVQELAQRLGHQCVTARLDVRGELTRTRGSLEMTARRLRHAFLARVAQEHGATTIALAHHADDQAELFFLRLLRGAGGEGLGGMAWRSPSPADPRCTLIRPLLDVPKADLLAHATARKLEFREDASNADRDILRNRVRHELLPRLARDFTPAIREVAVRAAELVGAEADFVREAAARWLTSARRTTFARLHVAVQRAVIREQLWQLGHAGDFQLVERLRSETAVVSVGASQRLLHDGAGRVETAPSSASLGFTSGDREIELNAERGSVEFAGLTLDWRRGASRGGRPRAAAGRELFDADRVGARLRLRHWQAGDRFQPLGFPQAAKLQNLFVNRKIPVEQRRGLVVAEAANGELCWVEGLPPGEAFKLTAATRRRLTLRWRRGD